MLRRRPTADLHRPPPDLHRPPTAPAEQPKKANEGDDKVQSDRDIRRSSDVKISALVSRKGETPPFLESGNGRGRAVVGGTEDGAFAKGAGELRGTNLHEVVASIFGGDLAARGWTCQRRVSPIVAKPPALMAAVFPWDCENGFVTVKKQDEAVPPWIREVESSNRNMSGVMKVAGEALWVSDQTWPWLVAEREIDEMNLTPGKGNRRCQPRERCLVAPHTRPWMQVSRESPAEAWAGGGWQDPWVEFDGGVFARAVVSGAPGREACHDEGAWEKNTVRVRREFRRSLWKKLNERVRGDPLGLHFVKMGQWSLDLIGPNYTQAIKLLWKSNTKPNEFLCKEHGFKYHHSATGL